MQSAVLAMIDSVCLNVSLSVTCWCQNFSSYDRVVFTGR